MTTSIKQMLDALFNMYKNRVMNDKVLDLVKGKSRLPLFFWIETIINKKKKRHLTAKNCLKIGLRQIKKN